MLMFFLKTFFFIPFAVLPLLSPSLIGEYMLLLTLTNSVIRINAASSLYSPSTLFFCLVNHGVFSG